jgi:hypothetical protein
MGDYYNVTRGPLTVTLTDKTVASISPKQWLFIEPHNESSASITQLTTKGFLVKSKVPRTFPSVPVEVAPITPLEVSPRIELSAPVTIDTQILSVSSGGFDSVVASAPAEESVLPKKKR